MSIIVVSFLATATAYRRHCEVRESLRLSPLRSDEAIQKPRKGKNWIASLRSQ
ncbi:hypothetical protein [Tardiphaga sp.]|jgi:hypothetical protein|uniref:hypothetical protein n=1 Tax=Tardiphaga sp. TaxID=1926292 RepID=UPI0037DA0D5A